MALSKKSSTKRFLLRVVGLGYNAAKVDYLGLNVAGARYVTGRQRVECQHAGKRVGGSAVALGGLREGTRVSNKSVWAR